MPQICNNLVKFHDVLHVYKHRVVYPNQCIISNFQSMNNYISCANKNMPHSITHCSTDNASSKYMNNASHTELMLYNRTSTYNTERFSPLHLWLHYFQRLIHFKNIYFQHNGTQISNDWNIKHKSCYFSTRPPLKGLTIILPSVTNAPYPS